MCALSSTCRKGLESVRSRYCFRFDGGALWTVPELLFESRNLIPTLQQLLAVMNDNST